MTTEEAIDLTKFCGSDLGRKQPWSEGEYTYRSHWPGCTKPWPAFTGYRTMNEAGVVQEAV